MRKVLNYVGMVLGVRSGTEEPSYEVVDRITGHPNVEIRCYGTRIAAQTEVGADDEAARSIGFRRLAGYIFGGNHSRTAIDMTAPVAQARPTKIAMTAPVAQSAAAHGSVIRFFMPASWTMATLPEPDDKNVTLVEVPGETVAVVRFSGDRSPDAVDEHLKIVRKVLAASRYRAVGEPVAWFYDPPFTLPFRRRNEVVIPVAPA